MIGNPLEIMEKHLMKAANTGEWLTTKQAAEYIGIKEQTLRKWRCTGQHELQCVKRIGRVYYSITFLEEFVDTITLPLH